MNKNILVAVAWPYVNGQLHIGHLAGYLIPADIFARYNRLMGNKVLMVSGSDCFGTPITVEADKRKLSPKDIVDEYHTKDLALFFDTLHLSYDLYTKTDTEQHINITQDIFVTLAENGYIFVDSTKQYYSPTENKFLPDRYVVGTCPFCGYTDSRSDQCDNCTKLIPTGELKSPLSNLSKQPVELRDTEHYFLDWPKLQPLLKDYVDKTSANWKQWVKSETYGWLNQGLQPRAITRDLDWGVPIPLDRLPENLRIKNADNKRIYVWFDAVIGYYSASLLWAKDIAKDENAWKDFWYKNATEIKHYYFMGKDNLVFHTLFWPGQLMGFNKDLHLPDVASVNMFLDLNGEKFSKSRGVTIDSNDFIKKFGNDTSRFYLTYIMPETGDASFIWADFKEKVNGVLVGNLGNFIHRVLSIAYAKRPDIHAKTLSQETKAAIDTAHAAAIKHLDNCEFRNYLNTLLELSSYGNGLVNKEEVWSLQERDADKFDRVMTDLITIVRALNYLMAPLLFDASDKLAVYFGDSSLAWNEITDINGFEINEKPVPLFKKLEDSDLGL